MDKLKAVTAATHKSRQADLCELTKGEESIDRGTNYFEARYRKRPVRQLAHRAKRFGMQLIPDPQPT